jgi:hypothetical protein
MREVAKINHTSDNPMSTAFQDGWRKAKKVESVIKETFRKSDWPTAHTSTSHKRKGQDASCPFLLVSA